MSHTFHPIRAVSLSNRAYDVIKWLVTVVSPALITLYVTLAQVWSWSGYEKVVLTISAVTLFLGALIGISSKRYGKEVDDLFSTTPPSNPGF